MLLVGWEESLQKPVPFISKCLLSGKGRNKTDGELANPGTYGNGVCVSENTVSCAWINKLLGCCRESVGGSFSASIFRIVLPLCVVIRVQTAGSSDGEDHVAPSQPSHCRLCCRFTDSGACGGSRPVWSCVTQSAWTADKLVERTVTAEWWQCHQCQHSGLVQPCSVGGTAVVAAAWLSGVCWTGGWSQYGIGVRSDVPGHDASQPQYSDSLERTRDHTTWRLGLSVHYDELCPATWW